MAENLGIERKLPSMRTGNVRIADCRRVVGRYFGIRKREMLGASRVPRVSYPRMMAMTLARELTGQSTPAVGYYLGGKDHATVLHATRQHKRRYQSDEGYALTYDALRLTLAVYAAQNALWAWEGAA